MTFTGHMSSSELAPVSVLDVRRARREQRDPGPDFLSVTADLLAEMSYADVTLHSVAERTGSTALAVAAHFPTKDALIAEIYLQRLRALPVEIDGDADVVSRVSAQVRAVALLFVDEPHLSVPCNVALMRNDDPAITPIRQAISTEIRRRLAAALGSGAWPEIHNTVETVVCGALLQVGAGMLSYRLMVEHVDTMLALLLPDS